MLDEKFQRNASNFAILLEYENLCSFFCFSFCATLFFSLTNALVNVGHSLEEKKVARNEKIKKLLGFSYSKNMANFEVFCCNISSSINLLFLKSDGCR